ncbi:MAG: hypothetical protein K5668_00345 [Lachnospiraceae bacterium]|nr:hypothetical protein [Lachnospiraceae bacterium]
MFRSVKRRLAIILAASLIIGNGTLGFAGELPVTDDEEIVEAVLNEADADVVNEDTADTEDADEVVAEDDEEAAAEVQEIVEETEGAAQLDDAADTAELSDAATSTVSDPAADPASWSKDPRRARYTYLMYLPRLSGHKDIEMVSEDLIQNGKKIGNGNKAVTGDMMPDYTDCGISFNCLPIESDIYVIYAYGINNEFDGFNKDSKGDNSASVNNGYGLDQDNKPAGVFDDNEFTWFGKNGGKTSNGKIIFDAAVIKWSSGNKAKKLRLYDVDNLKYKYNKFATVSFNLIDGKWKKLNTNAFQKGSKQPWFYPVFKTLKSYREADGTKVKVSSDDKKLLKRINKKMKNNKINFEIRRRPIAGTVSENYKNYDGSFSNPVRFASLIGDDLDFTGSGKLKKATLQFRSDVIYDYKALDSDDFASTSAADSDSKSGDSSGSTTGGVKAQSRGYFLTHKVVMKKLTSSEAGRSTIADDISNGNFKKSTKTNAWYTTKSIDNENTLIVYGANNMEGIAAFRKRKNKSVGAGYYKSDKDCFILSVDD